jgi:hypothetical protein
MMNNVLLVENLKEPASRGARVLAAYMETAEANAREASNVYFAKVAEKDFGGAVHVD